MSNEEPILDLRRVESRRTWPQRLLLGLNCVVILACFVGATALLLGRHYGNSIARVDLSSPPSGDPVSDGNNSGTDAAGNTIVGVVPGDPSAPNETFPPVDRAALNFLITGADNNACMDPDSPYAAAFGDRGSLGERSDTIMIMRVDPQTRRAAILSFPRDLWVKIDNRSSRINSAYVRNDPTKLINTIYANFGLGVDHFIQIDFCAFQVIVDAVGGVTVPFKYPARDKNTGLNVPEAGCFTFDGDHALAYVRSRHYMYQDEKGKWKEDPASDLGRISRQQDFLRRVLSSAINNGFNPSVARGIIDAATNYIVVDKKLTAADMLEFAGILNDFEPGAIATYQIEAEGATISGSSVLIPRIKGDNMKAILEIFRGGAPLAGAPAQVFETTTTEGTQPSTSAGQTTVATSTPQPTVPVGTVAAPEENVRGIVPPNDVNC